jgi:hypothetical protein
MKEVIAGLADIEDRMKKIEARMLTISSEPATHEDLDKAILVLEEYLHQVEKIENLVLLKKVALLERKLQNNITSGTK